jgi:hypothetical protein
VVTYDVFLGDNPMVGTFDHIERPEIFLMPAEATNADFELKKFEGGTPSIDYLLDFVVKNAQKKVRKALKGVNAQEWLQHDHDLKKVKEQYMK